MSPAHLFPILAVVFLVLAIFRIRQDKGIRPASKTWLILAVIFGSVSAWLNWHH